MTLARAGGLKTAKAQSGEGLVSRTVGMRASCLSDLANLQPLALTSKLVFLKLPQCESPRAP